IERGLEWFEYSMFFRNRFKINLIVFAFVATHNHFAFDKGGKLFKHSALVIKLPAGATEDDHLSLVGVLNSSAACFWLQQVCHNQGGPGGGSSKDEKWHDFYQFNGVNVQDFPLPLDLPLEFGRQLDLLSQRLSNFEPSAVCAVGVPTR